MNSRQAADPLVWFKSSHSGSEGGECVEVATEATTVHVRDSKDARRGSLTVTAQTWQQFVDLARDTR